jgi:hypothetical protein
MGKPLPPKDTVCPSPTPAPRGKILTGEVGPAERTPPPKLVVPGGISLPPPTPSPTPRP